jgi:hypothetical protein
MRHKDGLFKLCLGGKVEDIAPPIRRPMPPPQTLFISDRYVTRFFLARVFLELRFELGLVASVLADEHARPINFVHETRKSEICYL